MDSLQPSKSADAGSLIAMRKVIISGISGFVGSRLRQFLNENGFSVKGLSRSPADADTLMWDPAKGKIPQAEFEGLDAVINLAGASIAQKRWTSGQKAHLRDSRISSTRAIVEAMSRCEKPPAVFISMSGVNYYPEGGAPKSESDSAGDSFLSRLCMDWESEAMQAGQAGIRTVILRMGVVLDGSGGAMEKMLPAFRLGLGGRIGSGKQGFPWIDMTDLLNVILFAIETQSLSGAVNVVHPNRVSQGEFAALLAGQLNRPAILPLPGWLVRVLFGQMGEEMLLADIKVAPDKLLREGFHFKQDNLQSALRTMFIA